MGSDHLLSQISVDKPLQRNIPLDEPCHSPLKELYRLDKTDEKLLQTTLRDILNTTDTNIDAQDKLEEPVVTLFDVVT